MDREWIMKEKEKWQDEKFLEEVLVRLNEHEEKIDEILYERYSYVMNAWANQGEQAQRASERMKKKLMDRGLIDEQGNLCQNKKAISFADISSVNGGTNTKGEIMFNPKGAQCFYDSYLEFLEGEREGIRDFDYSKDINELPELTSAEALYWCYCHEINYEEFVKITLLHESVHKWTLLGNFLDDQSETELIEGMVEQEARRVGKGNPELGYIPIFRSDDVKRAAFLENYENPIQFLCVSTAENFELNALIAYYEGDVGKANTVMDLVGDYITRTTNPEQKKNDFSKSIYKIFLERKPKSHKIIEIMESYKDKKIDDVEGHDVAGEDR